MRKRICIAVFMTLAIVLADHDPAAADGSRFSIKTSFGVSGYPSDKDVISGRITPAGAVEAGCESKTFMRYHFDEKFGKTIYGAVCYRMQRNLDLELELGFGYTDLEMEITQVGTGITVEPCQVESQFKYDTVRDSEFRIFTIRPGVNLRASSAARYAPYLILGLDIMMVRGRANLDFGVPEVQQLGPDTYVAIADEPLVLDGSQTVMGLDVGSGLEFRLAPAVSIAFGLAYTFEFQKVFKDFNGVVSSASTPTAAAIDYHFNGMNVANIGALVSLTFHL